MEKLIKISEYTKYPGPRLRKSGDGSGEEFYEDYLEPVFRSLGSDEKVIINLDDVLGFPPSFLSEAFGRLYRNFGGESVWDRIIFISKDDPLRVSLVKSNAKPNE